MAIQDFTFEALMALRDGLRSKKTGRLKRVGKDTAKAITDLCRANDAAQDRIRIHRGIPLPGSVKQPLRKGKPKHGGAATPQPVASCGVGGNVIEPIPAPAEGETRTKAA